MDLNCENFEKLLQEIKNVDEETLTEELYEQFHADLIRLKERSKRIKQENRLCKTFLQSKSLELSKKLEENIKNIVIVPKSCSLVQRFSPEALRNKLVSMVQSKKTSRYTPNKPLSPTASMKLSDKMKRMMCREEIMRIKRLIKIRRRRAANRILDIKHKITYKKRLKSTYLEYLDKFFRLEINLNSNPKVGPIEEPGDIVVEFLQTNLKYNLKRVQKLRLRVGSSEQSGKTMATAIDKKKQITGTIRPIDVEILHQDKKKLASEFRKKQNEFFRTNEVNIDVAAACKKQKIGLEMRQQTLDSYKKSTTMLNNTMKLLQKEEAKLTEELSNTETKIKQIERMIVDTDAPSILDYFHQQLNYEKIIKRNNNLKKELYKMSMRKL